MDIVIVPDVNACDDANGVCSSFLVYAQNEDDATRHATAVGSDGKRRFMFAISGDDLRVLFAEHHPDGMGPHYDGDASGFSMPWYPTQFRLSLKLDKRKRRR